ncbi:MAG TPA: DNA adenine methylase, partial [Chloroflexia bacterium]|nr:DNA adenine methylase [Chloroflexia bacterium]
DLKLEAVKSTLAQADGTQDDKAFKTILKNRVNRGVILAPGAGLIKHGENGKGLTSRWYPDTLRRRILDIGLISERIEFIEGDGITVLHENVHNCNAVFFIDPPYTAAGKKAGSRLYTHSELRHEELFRLSTLLAGDFLMTYDNTDEIRELAGWYGLDMLPVAMKNTHHAKMTELLIGRDLGWARG